MKIPAQVKPALVGAAAGALIIILLGFTVFGWVTGGKADRLAKERAESAVVAALAPVCVEKFKESVDLAAKLSEFKKISYAWEQATFIEKGGWATMPGSEKPNSDVARACAEALSKQNP